MLYIVGTPIGNLKEFSENAVLTLNMCDYILCEDTRTSQVLLNHFNIKKPLKSYHKFNETKELESIISDLEIEKNIGLISDAGMPCISDPGNILVNAIKKKDIKYSVISGPSALINAFILSGYNAPFMFIGFLPEKEKQLNTLLSEIKNYKTCLIFYVSCHDVEKTFNKLHEILGEREVCVAREITKVFENTTFTTLSKGYNGVLKGEFVLVINHPQENNELFLLTLEEHLKHYLNLGFSKNDAVKIVAKERGIKKDEVYKIAINL